jgi:hypothetical protein
MLKDKVVFQPEQGLSVNWCVAGAPVFTKPLQPATFRDYEDVTLSVRCDGVPKPEVHWARAGVPVVDDDRHTVTTTVGGQVDSQLDIKHFNAADAGKVNKTPAIKHL